MRIRAFLPQVKRDEKGSIILPTLICHGRRTGSRRWSTPGRSLRRGCDQGAREVRPQGFSRASSPRRFFWPGCNFRCPYCHNADLVVRPETLADIPLDFFLAFLDSRKGWLEGVCVSGGEPLLEPEIEGLLAVIKERGFLVKLDTNGSRPDDSEAYRPPDSWTGWPWTSRRRSTGIPKSSGPPSTRRHRPERRDRPGAGPGHLFRTTVVPGLVGEDDIRKIGEWLDGAPLFQIQSFTPIRTLDPAFQEIRPYGRDEIDRLADSRPPVFRQSPGRGRLKSGKGEFVWN